MDCGMKNAPGTQGDVSESLSVPLPRTQAKIPQQHLWSHVLGRSLGLKQQPTHMFSPRSQIQSQLQGF